MPIESLTVRLEDVARRVLDLETELRLHRPEVLATRLDILAREMLDLAEEARGLRRAVVVFAISVAGSAVVFALTVLRVWGGG